MTARTAARPNDNIHAAAPLHWPVREVPAPSRGAVVPQSVRDSSGQRWSAWLIGPRKKRRRRIGRRGRSRAAARARELAHGSVLHRRAQHCGRRERGAKRAEGKAAIGMWCSAIMRWAAVMEAQTLCDDRVWRRLRGPRHVSPITTRRGITAGGPAPRREPQAPPARIPTLSHGYPHAAAITAAAPLRRLRSP